MAVSLHDLIKEWEVVNAELWRASQESHRRYPFPANSDGGLAGIDRTLEGPSSSSSPPSSAATYARVYNLLSRVRHVSEDARYNSFYIIQHLLWVTMVAWANQLANASSGLVRLPIGMRQYHESSSSRTTRDCGGKSNGNSNDKPDMSVPSSSTPVQRTSFSCALLPQLEFWDPCVLGETTGTPFCTPGNLSNASPHRAPNLPEVWSDAVQRIFALWCTTPCIGSCAEAAQPCNTHSACDTAAPATIQYAHTWVIVAQHYHRFKSLLSLFFLRYDALLEDTEEQLQRRGRQQQQQQHRRYSDFHEGQVPRTGTNSPRLLSFLLRRRGEPSHALPFSTTAPTASCTSEGGAPNPNEQARVSPRPRSSIPSTANLLGHLMQSIANENLEKIHEATGGALIFLLLPRVYRARLRHQDTAHVSGMDNTSWSDYALPHDKAGTSKWYTSRETQRAFTTMQELSDWPDWQCSAHDDDDEGEDDDHVVWSSPPSPLLSYKAVAAHHCNGDAPAPADRAAGAPCTACRVGGLAQQQEYVMRNVFKVLFMIEDCRLHALQRWLVEDGKRVASFYGFQLAANLFDDTTARQVAFPSEPSSCGPSVVAITTTRTLADANRVLRETLQAYVRLRAKLLFLNAGTTHFLDALTPWGRTRMLESLNAFLFGFSGLFVPSRLPSDGEATGKSTAVSSNQEPNQSVTSLHDGYDESVLFTPANAGVTEFAQRWGVPLWVAMCDDTQRRMEALKREEEKRAKRPQHGMAPAEYEYGHTTQPAKQQRQQRHATDGCPDEETGEKDRWSSSLGDTGASSTPFTPSRIAAACSAGDDDRADKPDVRDRHSVASTELEDAVSRTASVVWPPRSPTVANVGGGSSGDGIHSHSGTEEASRPLTRRRGRGLDLKRVLHQQQQRRARLGDVKLPQRGVTASRIGASVAGSEDGGGDAVESLYTGETASVGDDGSVLAAAVEAGNDGGSVDRLLRNTGAAATEVGQHGGGQGPAISASSPEKRLSRSAQLHQVATLPDEGFPCLLYLMPRRSRFAIQDKAAAAVQQQLLTRFSANVQAYLTDYLMEFETTAADHRVGFASPKKKREKAAQVMTMGGNAATGTVGAPLMGIVTPLPQPVLARMAFLLEMTYAALQGRGGVAIDSRNDHSEVHNGSGNGGSLRPLMETGLTATGQELGAAILEQCNGEFDRAVSIALSTPTSPALLAIAAVRKGFQGFLTSLEKRAVLALAKALYDHVQQGVATQPPAARLDAVDTILNMASLLNSKDMFVLLLKGYLAPQVMMCRSQSELVVESQVVSRMAYRLGAAVTAPCLTLLRDLQLAMSDPHSVPKLSPPFSGHPDFAEDRQSSAAHESFSDGGRRSDGVAFGVARSAGITAECALLAAPRDAEMLAPVRSLYQGAFGLIHRLRVLCQVWWQPHTTVLLSSRRLCQLWEQHQLLDERIVDAVLSVEWQYQGHSEPYGGYGELARLRECEGSSHSPPSRSGGGDGTKSIRGGLNAAPEGAHSRHDNGGQHTGPLSAGTQLRTVTAAAVVRGFSSALGNAVRRTGRQAGDFGYHDSDNESEDYREAYGGLLTLSTLQQHRSAHAPSSSSHRGSNLSSVGSPGAAGGAGAGGEHWGTSDGRQSTIADDRASTAVPVDGQLERRRLRWPLGNGQLTFYLFSRGTSSTDRSVSEAVQIFGPPITLLVCQLLDRAREQPYTFDALHKALPVQAPKPLLAHLLHELVKADVVVRSVAAGTRQLTYQLRDDTCEARQRKIVIDVRAAAQQQWVVQAMTMMDAGLAANGQDDSPERDMAREPASPANPAHAVTFFPKPSLESAQQVHIDASAKANASPSALVDETSSLTYLADRAYKIKVCIVRVMKAERVLSHRELAERVALALEDQFVVTPGQFKSCVAHLIEKELLQRGEQGEYMFVS